MPAQFAFQRRIARLGMALTMITVALLAAAGPAQATFPGENGRIAYETDRDGNFEIYRVNNNGTGDTRLTTNTAADVSAAWSPDGQKIAFASNRDGNYEIYVMDANGGNQVRLTNNAALDDEPSWSPDGSQIVFTSYRDNNDAELFKMSSTGTGVTQIVNVDGFDGEPNWSSDGNKIVFTSHRNGNYEIYKINSDGTTPQRLTTNSADDGFADWSPDGKRIIWETDLSGNYDIWAMNADGSSKANATAAAGDQNNPVWAPDNANFAYSGNQDGDQEIFLNYCCGYQLTSNSAVVDDAPSWEPIHQRYVRPKAATPIRLALVPAYNACASPNSVHNGVVSSDSCNPPAPTSPYLTVGTQPANQLVANMVGSVYMQVFCNGGAANEQPPCMVTAGDQLDGKLTFSLTDIRCLQGGTGGCGNGPKSDYQGDVLFKANIRVTDENSYGFGGATVVDFPLNLSVACSTTGGLPDIGSNCSEATSLDALFGGSSAITEMKRAIWDIGDPRVLDGGNDGVAATEGDNYVFARTGLFFP